MNHNKKFIPCIYLYQGMAVTGFQTRDVVTMNPVEMARFFSDHNADELILFDLSTDDLEHEEALLIIKKIAAVVEIPVIGAGNVHRMEDIKKLLYAGCSRAVLNFSKEENRMIAEEVSLKFGKEKLIASFDSIEVLSEAKDLMEQYTTEFLCIDERVFRNALQICVTPMIVMLPEVSLDKMLEVLAVTGISGISGTIINENAKEIPALKVLCEERGIVVATEQTVIDWLDFKLNSEGLLPVVVQDYKTEQVLMVAYMNKEAYHKTLQTGKMTYFSRSRNELWIKGETSGHFQYLKALYADCDQDTLLAKVSQIGPACHTGSQSCFFTELVKKEYDDTNPLKVFEDVFAVIKDRKITPKEGSYTNYLFDKGIDKILKKLGEEATEIVIASKNPNPEEIKYEISDFLYHMMVLMVEKGVSWEEITTELANR